MEKRNLAQAQLVLAVNGHHLVMGGSIVSGEAQIAFHFLEQSVFPEICVIVVNGVVEL